MTPPLATFVRGFGYLEDLHLRSQRARKLNTIWQNVNFRFMWQYFVLIVSLHLDPVIRTLLII